MGNESMNEWRRKKNYTLTQSQPPRLLFHMDDHHVDSKAGQFLLWFNKYRDADMYKGHLSIIVKLAHYQLLCIQCQTSSTNAIYTQPISNQQPVPSPRSYT